MDYLTYREQRLGGFDPINDPVVEFAFRSVESSHYGTRVWRHLRSLAG